MIDYIINIEDFEKIKSNLFLLFNKKFEIENNPFNDDFKIFFAIEFDFLFTEDFFNGIKIFLKKIDTNKFYFYTINPSPEKYFFKHFNKFNAFEVNLNNTDKELSEIMMKNPKDSPSDALALNSDDIVWFSHSKEWAILGSRDLEIAIVGLTINKVKDQFLSSFNNFDNIFLSVEEQIENLDDLIGFDDSQKVIYSKLIKNYSSRS